MLGAEDPNKQKGRFYLWENIVPWGGGDVGVR